MFGGFKFKITMRLGINIKGERLSERHYLSQRRQHEGRFEGTIGGFVVGGDQREGRVRIMEPKGRVGDWHQVFQRN